jgi:two-component system invasion response regulator UvrY
MYYLSPKLEQRVIQQHLKKTPGSETELLTDRELEVLVLIASGKTPREVAEELCLSRKTVDTYRARIRKKLGLCTPVEYLQFARDHQLLAEP